MGRGLSLGCLASKEKVLDVKTGRLAKIGRPGTRHVQSPDRGPEDRRAVAEIPGESNHRAPGDVEASVAVARGQAVAGGGKGEERAVSGPASALMVDGTGAATALVAVKCARNARKLRP